MGTPLFDDQRGVYQVGIPGKDKTMTEQSDLPPAAQRALAEAEQRRAKARAATLPKEVGGRDGPEPVRYGDWENKGLAVDF